MRMFSNKFDRTFEQIKSLGLGDFTKSELFKQEFAMDKLKDSMKIDVEKYVAADIESIFEQYNRAIENEEEYVKQDVPVKTTDEKLDETIYNLREIESLFYALSLGLSNPSERESFDTVFNNWKNDQLAKRY